MGAIASIRTSIKTLSARIDSAGGVISYGILAAAFGASVWALVTMVIPNSGLAARADDRLNALSEKIEVNKANVQRLDDEIRALESPYHVALIARKLGFVPKDQGEKPVLARPGR
jgi:hypothetical protein